MLVKGSTGVAISLLSVHLRQHFFIKVFIDGAGYRQPVHEALVDGNQRHLCSRPDYHAVAWGSVCLRTSLLQCGNFWKYIAWQHPLSLMLTRQTGFYMVWAKDVSIPVKLGFCLVTWKSYLIIVTLGFIGNIVLLHCHINVCFRQVRNISNSLTL